MGKPKNWSYERYAVMLRLYVHLELSLKVCYPDRLRRHTEKLDNAFGRFFCEDATAIDAEIKEAENVRKIRQEMNRRLRECAGSAEG